MDPVEINAGAYYLRQLRADRLIDDRPALIDAFADENTRRFIDIRLPDLAAADDYIADRARQWQEDRRYCWAVAQQNTGDLLAELNLMDLRPEHGYAELGCWTHPERRGQGITAATIPAVLRFAFGALGLHHIGFLHAASNHASRRVAEKCGFTVDGRMRESCVIDGRHEDMLIWSRLSTDD